MSAGDRLVRTQRRTVRRALRRALRRAAPEPARIASADRPTVAAGEGLH
jgi:hypothetical protein